MRVHPPKRRADPTGRPHRLWLARAALCASVVMAAASALGLTAAPASASTAPPANFTLTVTPTQNLTDGQQMTVTVTRTSAGTAAGLEITWVAFAWCTASFTAPTSPGPISTVPVTSQFPSKWGIKGCTTKTHPLNSDVIPQTNIAPPANSTGDYPTVTGHTIAETSEGTPLHTYTVTTLKTTKNPAPTLTCDSSHSCTFTVAVFSYHEGTDAAEPPEFLSVPVTFSTLPPLSGCSGTAEGSVNSDSASMLGTTVTNWTIGACKAGLGGGGILADNLSSGQGDASALGGFANGTVDLAYSAVGYDANGAFTPSVDRPYVAIPVAIDAVVLGHVETYFEESGGVGQRLGVLGDFPQQLRITDAEAAQLLAGGPTTTAIKWKNQLGQALLAENPELGTAGFYFAPTQAITKGASAAENYGIVATSLVDGTTFFATSFFHTVAPHAMVSDKTGAQLGVSADFGRATPPFNVDSTTTTSLIVKALTPNAGQGFALLDASAAASMWGGLADFAIEAPSSIGSANPVYVAPTEASMDAATTEMIPQADGTALPNPDATPVDGVEPYPLTFIEYAIAPAQPLETPTCSPRTSSQQDLKQWLDYITGPGQSELPAGMEPLTPALEAQAQNAIAEVGTAKVTGSCATTSGASGSSTSASGGSGTSKGSTAAASGSAGATGTGAVAAGSFGSKGFGSVAAGVGGQKAASPGSGSGGGRSKSHAVAASLAGFNRVEEPGWLLPALGVLVLVLLLPGLAFLMSGRSLRPEADGGSSGSAGSEEEDGDWGGEGGGDE